MKKPKAPETDIAELRQRATRLVGKAAPKEAESALTGEDRLRQELEIHQMELELQNEELRNARVELEAGLDRYTQLFDFAPIGYATLGPDGTIRELNHAGASMLFETRTRLIGRRFVHLIAPYDRALFNDLIRNVLQSDTREVREFDLLRIGEERTVVRFTAVTLAGAVPTILLAYEDITTEKRAEERLLRADAALREADRRKDEFLAILSHELRTPLSALLLHGQLLRHGNLSEEKRQRAIEAIERAARTQARLVEDLLDISRIVAGKMSMRMEAVSLTNVIRQAVEGVTEAASKKRVDLIVDLPRTLSPMTGDAERLRQAVANLLTNAVKFTPTAGEVRLRVHEVQGRVQIQVQDTGTGIDPAFLPQIFDRFSQADRTVTRSTGGLGLGLSIARSIVETHHGSIRAVSPGRGKGSTFTIVLPVDGTVGAGVTRPSVPASRPDTATIHGLRLLVVEDDDGTRETLTEVLTLAGADVRGAEGSEEAMRVLRDFQPDVFVCDIAMPGEDGCRLLQRVRAHGGLSGGCMRAVALTAFATDEDRARTREAGFETHLVKPVDLDDLVAAVARLAPARSKETAPN